MLGTVFDIKEFALHDGEGIRTTVFMKGCPLRCAWCHNPEGLSKEPELYLKQNGCTACGLCKRGCAHEDCKPFGRCLHICPGDLVSVSGKVWSASELAEKLLSDSGILNSSGGGITVSGGEPLMQHAFVTELLALLRGKVHRTLETSGFASEEVFRSVAAECDFIIMDIKLADDDEHKKYTGQSNALILKNASWLKSSKISHLFRTPLIPGITDTEENLTAISSIVGEDKLELLPYNTLAPAKYESVGRTFPSYINQTCAKLPDLKLFKNARIRK